MADLLSFWSDCVNGHGTWKGDNHRITATKTFKLVTHYWMKV